MRYIASKLVVFLAVGLPPIAAMFAMFAVLLVQSPDGMVRLWGWLLLFGAAALMVIAFRPRTVWVDDSAGEVCIAWGYRWPLVYRRIKKEDWLSFAVRRVLWHTVVARGSGYQTTGAAQVRWRVEGMTKKGRAVFIADMVDVKDAEQLRRALLKLVGILSTHFSASFRLGLGPDAGGEAREKFVKEHREAAKLYDAMGDSGRWEMTYSIAHYDMPDHSTMSTSNFDIPLLASIAGVKKPWKALVELAELSLIGPFSEKDIARAVELERSMPWVDAAVMKRYR